MLFACCVCCLRTVLRRHVHIQGMVQVEWKIKANVDEWSVVGCCENIYVLFLVFSEKGFYSFLFCFLCRDNVAHCFRFVLLFFFSFIILYCVDRRTKKIIQRWQRTMEAKRLYAPRQWMRAKGRAVELWLSVELNTRVCKCSVSGSLVCAFMPPKTNNGKTVILWHFGSFLFFRLSSPFGRLCHRRRRTHSFSLRNAGHNIMFGYLYCLYLHLVRSIVCLLPLCEICIRRLSHKNASNVFSFFVFLLVVPTCRIGPVKNWHRHKRTNTLSVLLITEMFSAKREKKTGTLTMIGEWWSGTLGKPERYELQQNEWINETSCVSLGRRVCVRESVHNTPGS